MQLREALAGQLSPRGITVSTIPSCVEPGVAVSPNLPELRCGSFESLEPSRLPRGHYRNAVQESQNEEGNR